MRASCEHHASINRPYALDWRGLQEAQSRELRKRLGEKIAGDRASSEAELDNYMSAFDAEVDAKNARIVELEAALSTALASTSGHSLEGVGIISDELCRHIGQELYDGEISDRVRRGIFNYANSQNFLKSKRETYVLNKFLELGEYSGRSLGLVSEIKSAGRDANELGSRMGAILLRLGFLRTEDGKHLKFSPPQGLGGIDVAVLPKTSSDHRAGKNQASDLIEVFSIRDLHKD